MHIGLLLSIHQRSRMLSRKMSLRILFLLAGSLAGPSLAPAPLFYLEVSSDPLPEETPPGSCASRRQPTWTASSCC
ncbi:hypothetical protein G0U57_013002 [Chelydra serpentina]|uniref:Uncharacterized protein n=1 Tax=Chelydra serpentina TaxID=8475 RepID=A0A8T1SA73_CHESE|nr:hypothetical protein G0U57_013002 [Chelydra serpentina]